MSTKKKTEIPTYTYKYMKLHEFVAAVGGDVDETMDALMHSDVQMGGDNYDTLITVRELCRICGQTVPNGVTKDDLIAVGS